MLMILLMNRELEIFLDKKEIKGKVLGYYENNNY